MTIFPNSMKHIDNSVDHKINASNARVGIIMRTKNRPVLLVRALASVLSQKHQNWHLYLVNDGGDQEELEKIIKNYRFAFKQRLTVIHNKQSLGMEAASNKALDVLKADFVIVHDDDDAWHPEFLLKTLKTICKPENSHYAAIVSNCQVVREEIVNNQVIEKERLSWSYFRKNVSYLDLIRANNAPPIALLIRKTVVDKIGVFNTNLPVLGDWDYVLRVIQIGDIITIDEPLAYYHHRIGNSSAEYNNSITDVDSKHATFNTLYNNALVRETIENNPHILGLYKAMSYYTDVDPTSSGSNLANMRDQLNWIEHRILSDMRGQINWIEHRILKDLDYKIENIYRRSLLIRSKKLLKKIKNKFFSKRRKIN